MTKRRIVLVTGATRGLGAEVAAQLARSGHAVLLGGRDAELAEARAAALRAEGGDARALALDVTAPASVAEAFRRIRAELGRLDVLVNNAGVMLDGGWVGNTAPSIGEETLRATFETNLFAVVRVTQAALPLLREGRDPQIVNVSSVMGSNTLHADLDGPLAMTKPFAYCASKAALNALTIHLAKALAPEKIRVNSIHPGWVRTELGTAAAPLEIAEGARPIAELAARLGTNPTGRFLQREGELPW